MNLLRESGLARAVCTRARQGVPLLGICLGMQFLFDSSSEGGITPGLGLLPGTVEAIPGHTTQGQPLRVPHIGWAPLYPAQQREGFSGSTLEAIPVKSQVYFVHGYRAMPGRPAGGHAVWRAPHLRRRSARQYYRGTVSPGKKRRGGTRHSAHVPGQLPGVKIEGNF